MKAILREPRKIVPLCIAALFFLMVYISNSPNGIRVLFYPLFREFKKQSFVFENRNFTVCSSRNFNIYYRSESAGSIDLIEYNAEKDLKYVLTDFNYPIEDRINIIIYPEYDEMANKIGLGTGSTAMGVYYGGIISILDPVKWIDDTNNLRDIFQRDGPMVHELTHYILDYMSSGNIPIWFTEGAALYEEYRINGVKWADDKTYEDYYTPEELEAGFYQLDEIKAYKESFLAVKYIGDNYGMNSIIEITNTLKDGKSINQAIKSVLSISKEELFCECLSQNGSHRGKGFLDCSPI